MTNHNFCFEGGEILRSIGATWFVSYAYHEYIDDSHMNWSGVTKASQASRSSKYRRSREFHTEWLRRIASMSDNNLAKNSIGLSPIETKRMACRLLEISD